MTALPAQPVRAASEPAPAPAGVVSLESRRRRMVPMAVAAAAGAIMGGTVVWAAAQSGGEPARSEQFIAQAVLAPLADTVAAPGEASVVDSPDGRVVRVDARALPDGDGFYEVWLLDAEASKLVALGALPAGSIGTFTVPPGLSLEDYPVVDISLEDYDGDPTHSTNSLMRGTLEV